MTQAEKIKELRAKRAKALADARAINDQAAKEERSLSDEEKANYGKYMADFHRYRDDIEREQELDAEERALSELADQQVDADTEVRGGESRDGMTVEQREARAFEHWLRHGDYSEYRALQVDADVKGGYLVTPEQMTNKIIQAVDNNVVMRGACTVMRVPTAQSLGAVSLDSDPDDPEWTTELSTGNEDSSMAFGKRHLHPHPVATKLKVSKELLRTLPGILTFIYGRLGYKMGIKHENGFQNGSGTNQPLGVFVASDDGIGTGRDVSTDMGTTKPTVDGLKRVKGTLKPQYRRSPNCRWLMHRDVMTEIGLLKDGNGRYLLQDDIKQDDELLLLGKRVMESEYSPNTLTTGQYITVFGDFSHYWIADAQDIEIQRLVELYAGTNQDGFHIRSKTDGMPTLAEAFVRGKLG